MTAAAPPPTWAPDRALAGFEARTIELPADYDGPVVATLVRRRAPAPTGRAALYIHGFNDYFFQAHLAEAFVAAGYDFYALDLRKYGRSLLPHQRPNFCRRLDEYDAEISAAIAIVRDEEGHRRLVLNGHSTGGLIAALYAHGGERRAAIDALILNSPFFDFHVDRRGRRQIELLERLGRTAPYVAIRGLSPLYGQSIHRDHRGEWAFDTRLKPIDGFPLYFGWVAAVRAGQRRLAAGLRIGCPVLLLHSDRSTRAAAWCDDLTCADAVLNVEDMRRLGPGLGPNVSLACVPGGLHDLILSPPPVRAHALRAMFGWLGGIAARWETA